MLISLNEKPAACTPKIHFFVENRPDQKLSDHMTSEGFSSTPPRRALSVPVYGMLDAYVPWITAQARRRALPARWSASARIRSPSEGHPIALCADQIGSEDPRMRFCARQAALRRSSDALLRVSGGLRRSSDALLRRSERLRRSSDALLRASGSLRGSSDAVLHRSEGHPTDPGRRLRRSDRLRRILRRRSARLRRPAPRAPRCHFAMPAVRHPPQMCRALQ